LIPGPGNLSQNGLKPTQLMMSSIKKPKTKIFFSLQTTRLAESCEGLDSSLAQATGELRSFKAAQNQQLNA